MRNTIHLLLLFDLVFLPLVQYTSATRTRTRTRTTTLTVHKRLTPYDFDWHNNFARLFVARHNSDALQRIDLANLVLEPQSIATKETRNTTTSNNNNNNSLHSSFIDVVVFFQPDDERSNNDNKDDDDSSSWPRVAGVGAHLTKHYQDHVVYCCAPRARKAGFCQEEGTIILNEPLFQGIFVRAEIPPSKERFGNDNDQDSVEIPLRILIDIVTTSQQQQQHHQKQTQQEALLQNTSDPIVVALPFVDNSTINCSTTTTLSLRFDHGKPGKFVVALANCNPNGPMVQVHGTIGWQEIEQQPAEWLLATRTVFDVLLTAVLTMVPVCLMMGPPFSFCCCCCSGCSRDHHHHKQQHHWHLLSAIHKSLLVMLGICATDAAAATYGSIRYSSSSLLPVYASVVIMTIRVVKYTLSYIWILMISLGWGTSRESILPVWLGLIGTLATVCAASWILHGWKQIHDAEDLYKGSCWALWMGCLSTLLFWIWIGLALRLKLAQFRQHGNHAELILFEKFRYWLLFYLCLEILLTITKILMMTRLEHDNDDGSWGFQFQRTDNENPRDAEYLWGAAHDLTHAVVLLGIVRLLWRNSVAQYEYAGANNECAMEQTIDDKEDQGGTHEEEKDRIVPPMVENRLT